MKKDIEYYKEINADNPVGVHNFKLSLTQTEDGRVFRVGDTIISKDTNKVYEIAAIMACGFRAYLATSSGYVIAESDFLDVYEYPKERHQRLSKLREKKILRILKENI